MGDNSSPQPDLSDLLELCDLLRKARRKAKLSQGEIAEKLGTSRPLVSLWENGHAQPGLEHYVRFAEICDADWLLDLRALKRLGIFSGEHGARTTGRLKSEGKTS